MSKSKIDGPAVLAVRTRLGLSPEEFAGACGTNKSTIYRWESGDVSPHPKKAALILELSQWRDDELRALGMHIVNKPAIEAERALMDAVVPRLSARVAAAS